MSNLLRHAIFPNWKLRLLLPASRSTSLCGKKKPVERNVIGFEGVLGSNLGGVSNIRQGSRSASLRVSRETLDTPLKLKTLKKGQVTKMKETNRRLYSRCIKETSGRRPPFHINDSLLRKSLGLLTSDIFDPIQLWTSKESNKLYDSTHSLTLSTVPEIYDSLTQIIFGVRV